MRRVAFPVAGLAGLAVAVVPALAADQSVGTSGTRFVPDKVAVKPGEKVTIVNTGRGFHNVHWRDRAVAEFPPSSSEWSTERTFTAAGEYVWVCDPHEGSGMRGTVYVNAAGTVPGSGTTTTSTTPPPPGETTTETTPGPPPPGGTTTTAPPPAGDTTPPSVSHARARATRRGVRVVLRVSEPAKIRVRVLRRGRRVARRTFDVGQAGVAVLRIRRALRRGRYSVRLALVDAAGNASSRRLTARVR